jgi:hypothetical protein
MKQLQKASFTNFIGCYRIFLKEHIGKMFSDRITNTWIGHLDQYSKA